MAQISSSFPSKSSARPFVRRLLEVVYRPFVRRYLTRTRRFKYLGIKIVVHPGVFHPGLFFSSKALLRFLQDENLERKTFLEPGCGSGMISIFAAKHGAQVTALDLNKIAVQNTRENAEMNKVKLRVIESDLFDKLEPQPFDYIVLNPPFYPRDPKNIAEMAWYCGADFEYFRRLFSQLTPYYKAQGKIIMVLSEDCDTGIIGGIAEQHGFFLELLKQDGNLLENIFHFKISRAER